MLEMTQLMNETHETKWYPPSEHCAANDDWCDHCGAKPGEGCRLMLGVEPMNDQQQLNARLPARMIVRVRRDVLKHRVTLDCWITNACSEFLRLPSERKRECFGGLLKTVGRKVKP